MRHERAGARLANASAVSSVPDHERGSGDLLVARAALG